MVMRYGKRSAAKKNRKKMMFEYSKTRERHGVPIWIIEYGGQEIGFMTDFPLDGPTATIRIEAERPNKDVIKLERTVEASTVIMCYERAKEAHEAMIEEIVMNMIPC